MKTAEQMEEELDRLIQAHYYSEDYTLEWAVKHHRDGLSVEERPRFEEIILKRLMLDPSIVHISICRRLELEEAVPVLIAELDKEVSCSYRTRAIMDGLKTHKVDGVYEAIERFMDSSQEHEALAHLAQIDFARTKPYILRAMHGRHYLGPCLHVLYERKKARGLAALIKELDAWSGSDRATFVGCLENVLNAKQGDVNPFTKQEVDQILLALK